MWCVYMRALLLTDEKLPLFSLRIPQIKTKQKEWWKCLLYAERMEQVLTEPKSENHSAWSAAFWDHVSDSTPLCVCRDTTKFSSYMLFWVWFSAPHVWKWCPAGHSINYSNLNIPYVLVKHMAAKSLISSWLLTYRHFYRLFTLSISQFGEYGGNCRCDMRNNRHVRMNVRRSPVW